MRKHRRVIILSVLLAIVLSFGLIALDFYNVPSKCGFRIGEINWDFQSIAINAIITSGLFLITYVLIQQWDIKRQRNQHDIAILLLKQTYIDCKSGLELFDKSYYRQIISEKSEEIKSQVRTNAERFANSSFQNEAIIMELCKDGVISSKQLERYFIVKTFYLQYCTLSIAMPESKNLHEKTRELAEQSIEAALKSLESDNKPARRR